MKVLTIEPETLQRLRMAALRDVVTTAARIIQQEDELLEIEGNQLDMQQAVDCCMALAFAQDDIPQGLDEADGLPPVRRPRCAHGRLFSEACEHCDKPNPFQVHTAEDEQRRQEAEDRGREIQAGRSIVLPEVAGGATVKLIEGRLAVIGTPAEPGSFAEEFQQQQLAAADDAASGAES